MGGDVRQGVAEHSKDTHHVFLLLDHWNYSADRFYQDLERVAINRSARISLILVFVQGPVNSQSRKILFIHSISPQFDPNVLNLLRITVHN